MENSAVAEKPNNVTLIDQPTIRVAGKVFKNCTFINEYCRVNKTTGFKVQAAADRGELTILKVAGRKGVLVCETPNTNDKKEPILVSDEKGVFELKIGLFYRKVQFFDQYATSIGVTRQALTQRLTRGTKKEKTNDNVVGIKISTGARNVRYLIILQED